MPRTSFSRLSTAFVLIALLGLALPASALSPESRTSGPLSWIQEWIDNVWSVFVPEGSEPSRNPAIEKDSATNPDRGALIDPNGGPGR